MIKTSNVYMELHPVRTRQQTLWQAVRFGIVGVGNSIVDLLVLNLLLLRFPTYNPTQLVIYNSVAYVAGAFNSYFLNKYWTFRHKQTTTKGEFWRFSMVNGVGFLCNDFFVWIVAGIAHPLIINAVIWANIAKAIAIIATATMSYFGMRLWVFAAISHGTEEKGALLSMKESDNMGVIQSETQESTVQTNMSLSVVLPAHNEEAVIATTVQTIVATLPLWVQNFEVIVVNDGSTDNTKLVVEEIAVTDPHVRLINHSENQGYGAALVSGFESVTKDLAFFMDSDGQFDIHDLAPFFPLIKHYDAVLGYRIDRQDTWMRKLNAWGWKMLIRSVLGVDVRDIDCAFKLYHAEFFRKYRLETRGAMINAEILYKLKRSGSTYTQVGVRHLPRKSGRATGAKLSVIGRALRELFVYAKKWHNEERQEKSYSLELSE